MSSFQETVRLRFLQMPDPVLGYPIHRFCHFQWQPSGEALLTVPYPFLGVRTDFLELWHEACAPAAAEKGPPRLELSFAPPHTMNSTESHARHLQSVKNIIAVGSAKGGVGKSTTALNLAMALQEEGARVGLLDADIYGPSQALMLGGAQSPQTTEEGFEPVIRRGLQTLSMADLVTDEAPMIWRGPMLGAALSQLLFQTLWSDLDYLVLDLPPGTGDVPLTLVQKVPLGGLVVVTTPDDLALSDARRGIGMFRKVHVPILGIFENMSSHTCPHCDRTTHPFGEGGGLRLAEETETLSLGHLPLSRLLFEAMRSGVPVVASHPEAAESRIYRSAARRLAAQLAWLSASKRQRFPKIHIEVEV